MSKGGRPEDIGHPLDKRLSVGRTTSQDSGVGSNTNIIVASLEGSMTQKWVLLSNINTQGMAFFTEKRKS